MPLNEPNICEHKRLIKNILEQADWKPQERRKTLPSAEFQADRERGEALGALESAEAAAASPYTSRSRLEAGD